MRAVGLRKVALDTISGYHPCWLRLGLAIVLGKHIARPTRGSGSQQVQQQVMLREFVLEAFLADLQLASEHSFNQTRRGLQTSDYWVSHGHSILSSYCQQFSEECFAIVLDFNYQMNEKSVEDGRLRWPA